MPRSRTAYQRALRATSFAGGRCYQCCSRPARSGKKTCQFCYDQMLRRRNATADAGLCRDQCGRPQKPGFRRCVECLEQRRIWARDARAAKSGKETARVRPAASSRPPSVRSARLALIRAAAAFRRAA